MRLLVQLLLALVVLVIGGFAVRTVIANPRESDRMETPPQLPVVDVQRVERGSHRLRVRSQGEVRPLRDAELAAEVAGTVVELGERFVLGGFVEEGEVLVRLDARDREQALVEARAAVADAELLLAGERHEAEVAADEWERFGEGEPDPFLLRAPQLASAEAALAAAQARVERAERDLARSTVRAPFAARVAERHAELGEWLPGGGPVARLIGTRHAEVRLPVADADLAALELGLRAHDAEPVEVELSLRRGGRRWTWPAHVSRSEGEIDPRTRMLTLVAEVDDPYARSADADAARPPLLAGSFVQAELRGRELSDVFVIPRVALRDGDQLAVVEPGGVLRLRRVDPRFVDEQVAVLDSGLDDGELLCLTQLEIAVDGMRVQTREPEAPDADAAESTP